MMPDRTKSAPTLQEAPATGDPHIDALRPWFHNIHLPDGRQTSPHHSLGDFPMTLWRTLEPYVPADLDGATALDIGCNAGFYTVQLAARGARVRAIDVTPHYLAQAAWVVDRFGLSERVSLEQQSVYGLLHERERYDIVWFTGVLYHLRHPLLALDLVARATRQLAIVQTLTKPNGSGPASSQRTDVPFEQSGVLADAGWPSLSFIRYRFAGDPTNWWVPNERALRDMLATSGLEAIAHPERGTCVCKPAAAEAATTIDRTLRTLRGEPLGER